jgi:amidophosphoribosyltransferase
MRNLQGQMGIGHVRYPTAGSASNSEEAQPFYVNAPFGIVLGHNGNLTNAEELQQDMFRRDRRHINTESDSEVLLNVFAHELQQSVSGLSLDQDAVFRAVEAVHKRARGAYACVVMIAGYGIVAFRDRYGIRPLALGRHTDARGDEWMVASETVALQGMGFEPVRDVEPGECLIITLDGDIHSKICDDQAVLNPCVFEYVYFARPDSVIDGVSVYDARLKMGETLAEKVRQQFPEGAIDVVMPIPDSSRPAAMQLAMRLGIDYREGFIKNRYIGRTFIMPGQEARKKSVRQKLNAIASEFKDKSVLIVDDSIVRGTTSQEIVQMARDSGAKRVIFAAGSISQRLWH